MNKPREFWLSNCGLFPLRAMKHPHEAKCIAGCDGLNLHVIEYSAYQAALARVEKLERALDRATTTLDDVRSELSSYKPDYIWTVEEADQTLSIVNKMVSEVDSE